MVLSHLVALKDAIWIAPMVMIALMGIIFTIKFKGTQIVDFKESLRVTFKRSEFNKSGLSSLKIFYITIGSRVGIGNITGPILAILIGGPGAIFWMWVFGVLGMATSIAEVTLGQIYKRRIEDGTYRGGTAYIVRHGLGLMKISKIVTILILLTYVVGGISLSASGAASAFENILPGEHISIWIAITFTVLTALIIRGGAQRVADVSFFIVPGAVLFWFGVAITSILMSGGLIDAFASILIYAFHTPAAIGGGIGAMLLIGMQRGVLSNEAGIGTVTNISSMADVDHPVRQGLSQSLGVFIDLLICTMTSLVVLSYVDIHTLANTELESMAILLNVMEHSLGPTISIVIAICAFIFGFTTIVGDYIIGEGNLAMISDKQSSRRLLVVFTLIIVFVSSLIASDEIFVIIDMFFAVCGFINVIVVLKLANLAIEAFRDYKDQRKRGIENPVFDKDVLSDTSGIIEWDRSDSR